MICAVVLDRSEKPASIVCRVVNVRRVGAANFLQINEWQHVGCLSVGAKARKIPCRDGDISVRIKAQSAADGLVKALIVVGGISYNTPWRVLL